MNCRLFEAGSQRRAVKSFLSLSALLAETKKFFIEGETFRWFVFVFAVLVREASRPIV